MDIQTKIPPSLGWLETRLDSQHIDFLWEIIENRHQETFKNTLAGNISGSFAIEDKDDYFFKEVLFPHAERYWQLNGNSHPVKGERDRNIDFSLDGFWVNYQYQHEFNPYHHHGGIYSFAIWLKIPYDWKEQNKLPFLDGMKENDKKASNFEFEYLDILGNIKNYGYRLDKSMEGTMVFFPAILRHTVYPFYNCDEPRISVAGNLFRSA